MRFFRYFPTPHFSKNNKKKFWLHVQKLASELKIIRNPVFQRKPSSFFSGEWDLIVHPFLWFRFSLRYLPSRSPTTHIVRMVTKTHSTSTIRNDFRIKRHLFCNFKQSLRFKSLAQQPHTYMFACFVW